jgi:hypothetical protein
MDDRQRKRNRKWLILGGVGSISAFIVLLIFRSIPMASGTAALTVITIIGLKHLVLFIAVSSPAVALFQSVKPKLQTYCPWAPKDRDRD